MGAGYDSTSGQLLIGDKGGSNVFALNASTGRGISTIGTGFNPYAGNSDPVAFAALPGSSVVYAAVGLTNDLAIYDTANDQLLGTIPVGCGPSALGYDGDNGLLYVANDCSSNVTLINVTTDQSAGPPIGICGFPTALVWDPSNHDIYVACADTEEILVISATTESVVKHLSLFSTGSGNVDPVGLAYDARNGDIYVANNQASNVSIIDGATNRFVGSGVSTHGLSPGSIVADPAMGAVLVGVFPSGILPLNDSNDSLVGSRIDTGNTPVSLAYDPVDQLVYSANQGDDTVTEVDARTGAVVAPAIPLMFPMLRATYDPLNQRIYVATPDESFACAQPGSLLVVNTSGAAPTMDRSVTVGYGPEATAIDPTTGRVFVANFCSDNVTVVTGQTDRTLPAPLPVGTGPFALDEDSSLHRLFVANGLSGNVTALDSTNLTVVAANISAGAGPESVAVDPTNGVVYVANYGSNNLTRFNASSGLPAGSNISVGSSPEAALFDPINGELYVANAGSGSLTVINASSGAVVVGSLAAGSGPVALALDAVHDLLYVADAVGGTIAIVNATTNARVGSLINVGPDPQGVAYDPVHDALYVSDFSSGAISVLAATPVILGFNATPGTSEPGVVTVFSTSVAPTNASLSYNYSGLPPGCLSVDAAQFACVPTRPGNFSVSVTVTMSTPGIAASRTIPLEIAEDPSVIGVSATPTEVELGQNVTFSASATGGRGPLSLTWSGLPPGCLAPSVPAVSVNLTCTPTAAGTFGILVLATDGLGRQALGGLEFSVAPALAVVGLVPSATSLPVGARWNLTTVTSGGIGPDSYSYSNLPPGCASVNASTLSCVPTTSGTYPVYVHVVDSAGGVAGASTSLQVQAVPVPTLVLAGFFVDPANITLGASVAFYTAVTTTAAAVTFAYSGLPPGCSPGLNVSSFRCAPSEAGTFRVSVEVAIPNGPSANASSLLVVLPTPTTGAGGGGLGAGAVGWAVLAGVGIGLGVVVGYLVGRRRAGRDAQGDSPGSS